MMAERPKLLYIIVEDVQSEVNTEQRRMIRPASFRYTRPVLQSTVQFIGCKPRHAFKISNRVFEILAHDKDRHLNSECGFPLHDLSERFSDSEIDSTQDYSAEEIKRAAEESEEKLKEVKKNLYDAQKRRSTLVLTRNEFMDAVCDAMSEYRYFGPNQRNDFALACKIREKRASVTILLCGTSGCGKSTLSTLLAARLGITTVVSTDSIRHMMRSFVDERDNPLLYASTYSAGEHLDPAAIAEAKMKKMAMKITGKAEANGNHAGLQHDKEHFSVGMNQNNKMESSNQESDIVFSTGDIKITSRTMAIEGYKAQSEMVIDSLDRLITLWEQKCESVIIEGVHLNLDFVTDLMKRHPTIIPFMIYIANEEKHLERFAIRAKYMTLDPAKNKYVKYIRNIRTIQEYHCKKADKHMVPKVNNTNMDQSVASIHATVFACLRRRDGGEAYYDPITNTVRMVYDEYNNQHAANSLGSERMLQIIHQRGSSRHLIALVNNDGSVAKAWPVEMSDGQLEGEERSPYSVGGNKVERSCSSCIYEPVEMTVNLQFGYYGLSAWENEIGGTSYGGSMDGLSSKAGDVLHSLKSSGNASSCSSSSHGLEAAEKELLHENGMTGSDEEQRSLGFDSEKEDDAGSDQPLEELEVEGSVADGSISSDEEREGEEGEEGEQEQEQEDYSAFGEEEGYCVEDREAADHQKRDVLWPLHQNGCGEQQITYSALDRFPTKEEMHAEKHHLRGRSKSCPLTAAAAYASY